MAYAHFEDNKVEANSLGQFSKNKVKFSRSALITYWEILRKNEMFQWKNIR